MNSFHSVLPLLAASCLVLACVRVRRIPRKRGFVEVSPYYRSFFRQHGLTDARHFLDLPGERPHIVSGHPDRHVARVQLGSEPGRWVAFLKREHRVSWRTRLGNALAGFGFLSRSVREARTLQMLQREGLPGPEWLAVGEDGKGRAFLLVREVAGTELRAFLRAENDPARRQRIARNLGLTLARLHNAGFRHPDLYANHLFVDPRDDSIHLLDWQRSRLARALSWRERRRDLAALHATVGDLLATPRERLVCLGAYWRAVPRSGIRWRAAAIDIESAARRLLARRHIREKRQPPAQPQAWICLEGEALCVTPLMQRRCGGRLPDWLPALPESRWTVETLTRRWPALPDDTRALLVRRHERKPLTEMWCRLWRRSVVSPEQRQAALLLRLQRHAVAAPQVLALGQRRDVGGQFQSFLLTEPLTDTCSLEAWLACQTRRRTTRAGQARQWSVLRQVGTLLHRLHEASCYLDMGPAGCGLAVRRREGEVTVVLDKVETVTPRRQQQPGRARRNVMDLQRVLRAAGCSRTDLCRFQVGYRQAEMTPNSRSSLRREPQARVPSRARLRLAAKQHITPGGDSLWRRLLRGVRRLRQRPDWPLFAGSDWAEQIMDVAITDRFHAKQGRSTGRWVLHAPNGDGAKGCRLSVYLKRHHELPWWQGLLAALWPRGGWSPAWREWQQLEWARRQGVPVPAVVAAAEYIGPGTKLRSCLAVEELSGMLSLQEAIPLAAVRQNAVAYRCWKRTLIAEMARLSRMLHDRRCFHKDFYLCHFYIARDDTSGVPAEGWRGRVYLIDLHRLAHQPLMWQIWQTKDLAQLLYSSEIVGVDTRDRLCFWREYCRAGPRRQGGAWLRRFVLFRWRRYRRHNGRDLQRRQNGQRST